MGLGVAVLPLLDTSFDKSSEGMIGYSRLPGCKENTLRTGERNKRERERMGAQFAFIVQLFVDAAPSPIYIVRRKLESL
jgi:hypothetical protein